MQRARKKSLYTAHAGHYDEPLLITPLAPAQYPFHIFVEKHGTELYTESGKVHAMTFHSAHAGNERTEIPDNDEYTALAMQYLPEQLQQVTEIRRVRCSNEFDTFDNDYTLDESELPYDGLPSLSALEGDEVVSDTSRLEDTLVTDDTAHSAGYQIVKTHTTLGTRGYTAPTYNNVEDYTYTKLHLHGHHFRRSRTLRPHVRPH